MKCEKCGMVCKDTQKFCLNCGNPLHPEEPEDIQEQLANSVGELLDGFDDDDDDDEDDFRVELDESMFEDEAVKVQKELQVENIYSRERAEEESEWEYDEDKYFDDMMEGVPGGEEELYSQGKSEKQEKKKQKPASQKTKKKKKKKKILITCIVVLIILGAAVGGGYYILDNIHFNLTSFDDYYRLASKEVKRKDYKTALNDAESALKKAQKAYEKAEKDSKKEEAKEELVKVRKLISNIYEQTDKIDDDYADNILQLVQLDTSLSDYFVKLAKYYSENKPPKVLTDFLRTISDDNEDVIKALKNYIVPVPSSDKPSGSYSQQFAVTLTCDSGSAIWYTIDGQDPSTHGIQYTEPIKITAFRTPENTNTESGVTTLKAITINADKVESKVEEFTYEIVLSSAEPVVTPDSGVYTDYTEIKVEVPQGSKCYYTIADGSAKPADPDASSNLYIADETQYKEVYGETKEEFKPLEMLRGTHIMKFVLIDEYGIASEVAVRSYNLEVKRNISLNEAENLVNTLLHTENIINEEGKNEAGHIVKAEWDETVIVDNIEYYVVYAVEKDDAGTELAKTMYLVDSYDKGRSVIKDATYENGQYVIPKDTERTDGETETADQTE